MLVITGGAGFIGSHLAYALEKAELGPLVICDDLGNGGKWRNIARRTLEDIVPPAQLLPWLDANGREVEIIYHMGAISSTTETHADKILASNYHFPQGLFGWCVERRKRLIYASSAATYGGGEAGFEDREDSGFLKRLKPLNLYGWSKNLFDKFVSRQKESRQALPPQCAGLKFFNVYGPNEYHKESQRSVAHQIYPFARRGEAFPLFKSHRPGYPDGGQMRDFVWVGDCSAVMLWLARNPQVSGLFNLGSGTARSFYDLAKAVYNAAGQDVSVVYRDMPENLRDHYQYFTEAPMQKLKNAGYPEPLTSLEDGMGQYVKNYLAKDDPYC